MIFRFSWDFIPSPDPPTSFPALTLFSEFSFLIVLSQCYVPSYSLPRPPSNAPAIARKRTWTSGAKRAPRSASTTGSHQGRMAVCPFESMQRFLVLTPAPTRGSRIWDSISKQYASFPPNGFLLDSNPRLSPPHKVAFGSVWLNLARVNRIGGVPQCSHGTGKKYHSN